MANLHDWLNEILPCGSGINCGWKFQLALQNRVFGFWIYAGNSYQVIDEHGGHAGWVDFTAVIDVDDTGELSLQLLQWDDETSQRLAEEHGLRPYLEDTIAEALKK